MKPYKVLLSLFLVAGMLFIAACDGSDGPSKEQKFIQQLSFSWKVDRVMLGGKDVTRSFNSLNLVVNSDKTYSVTNPVSPIWPAEGTFELEEVSNSDLFNFLRDDGVVISVTELTSSTLKFTLPYVASGARTNGISGDYEFSMTRLD